MLHLSLLQPALRFCLAPLWPSKTKQDRDSGPPAAGLGPGYIDIGTRSPNCPQLHAQKSFRSGPVHSGSWKPAVSHPHSASTAD